MNIDLSHELMARSVNKLKANKACGPEKVSTKLLKSAGSAILPSLVTVYRVSAAANKVPDSCNIQERRWNGQKQLPPNIVAVCIPGRLMETTVASTMTSGVARGYNGPQDRSREKSKSGKKIEGGGGR